MKANLSILALALVVFSSQWVGAQIYDTNNEVVQTFAGFGIPGNINGQGQLTEFSNPTQIVSDTASNLYVWDSGNQLIRKISPDATVSTLAGGGNVFEGSGTNVSFGLFNQIGNIAIDHKNTIWMTVSYNYTYLLNISTNGNVSIQNGGPGLANLGTTSPICFDSANNLYYGGGNRVYRYNPTTGISQVFAGNGISGYLDGQGTVFTEFPSVFQLVCDQADNVYVWDGSRLRKIDQSQNVSTVLGPSTGSGPDGFGTNVFFNNLYSMCSDNAGNIYFACSTCIRKMNAQGFVDTLAGNYGQSGYTNGAGFLARFNNANSACLSQGMIFVADAGNNRIRNISYNPQPQLISAPNLGIATYAGLTLTGLVGRTYQIQSSPNMSTWTTQTTLLLTSSPYFWIDPNPASGKKFYRALLMP